MQLIENFRLYAAPEISSVNYTSISDESVDWWSLGAIAYEIIVKKVKLLACQTIM